VDLLLFDLLLVPELNEESSMNHRVTTWRSLGLVALALVFSLSTLACSWSVPADPGLNFLRRTRPEAAPQQAATPVADSGYVRVADDSGARALYMDHCSRCHAPFDPSAVTAAQWPMYVAKYGPRAGLFGANRERVLRWLQANGQ
jgi:hypothetical protein